MKACHLHFTSRLSLALVALWLFAASGLGSAWAETPPTFTVIVDSAFLHNEPKVQSPKTYSIFRGQVFPITRRTADNAWVQLDFSGNRKGTWVWSPLGKVTGDLSQAPVLVGVTATPTAAPTSTPEKTKVSASGGVTFTVNLQSIFGRTEPNLYDFRILTLFKGQKFMVLARTPDRVWVKIASSPVETWVLAEYGTFTDSLKDVTVEGVMPLAPEAPALRVSTTPAILPPIPKISAWAREIYQIGLKLGNDPRVFAKVGDCNSTTPYFLAGFDSPGSYRLGKSYESLQETIQQFAGSFARQSQAAQVGFSTTSVLSSRWATPAVCRKGETPLACEYRLTRPSLAIVSLGTNGEWLSDRDFETGLRNIIDYSIQRGVVPILGTKSDDVEGAGRYTAIVVRLANEYSLPLWDFRTAAASLSDHGLMPDGYHLTWSPASFDDPAQINTGWQVRNLTALQMLDAVWRAVR